MSAWLTNVLAVIGALWIVCAVALGMFAVACWAARLGPEWADDDLNDDLREGLADLGVDAQALPLSQSAAARRIREQIVNGECRRFRDEIEQWGGGAA